MLIILFLVLYFNFLFVPCGRLSWLVLPVSFLLHVKHTLSYRIVSYQTSDVNLRGPWDITWHLGSLRLTQLQSLIIEQ